VIYKVLTLGDPRRLAIRHIAGWEFHTVPPRVGPPSVAQLPPHRGIANSVLREYIAALRPHFVIVVCEGCIERRLDRFGFPPGPRYITWSTDSYRHTARVTTSDLHLTAVPDAAMTPGDQFLPLFAGPYDVVPLERRRVRCGIVCRSYDLDGGSREREIARLKAMLPGLFRAAALDPAQYDRQIVDFAYGLNLAVYADSLPNFRSFELGRAGVMPVCSAVQRSVLTRLFAEHVLVFERLEDLPSLLDTAYDAVRLQSFYDAHHSYEARLRELFARFFDLRL
jgi:hypothetical protein